MFVEILCGGYGCCSGKSVHTVMRGEQCEVSEAEGARLIGLGMAKAVPVAANAPEIVPVAAPGASEGNDTPGSETSQDSPETACLDSEQLHSMAVANLKKLASDMGIDTKQLKTKDALIEAICAEEVVPGDECADGPELSAAMPTA